MAGNDQVEASRMARVAVPPYLPRLADNVLAHNVAAFPAVLVVGPRACGKTTSAARLAASVTRLDEPRTATLFRADPDQAVASRQEPALLDEWQAVPEILGAVKRAVDRDHRGARFVLTGSVTGDLDGASWPGTGRLIRMPLRPLAEIERTGAIATRPSVRDLLRGVVRLPADRPAIIDYVDLALRSGFPGAMRLDDALDRQVWLDGYVEQLVTRDVERVEPRRDRRRLRRYLQAWALNSAGIVDDTTIYTAVGIDRRTHLAYERLLEATFVADVVPAWTSNRLKRLALAPKRYIVDAGLMAAAAQLTRDDILGNGDLLGRLLDTFVHAQIRALLSGERTRATVAHLRTAGGRQEVDLLVEFDGGAVGAIEIKATSAPARDDARHLLWMRDALGSKFVGGVVCHTGPEQFTLADGIVAMPICALWGAATT